MRVKMVFEDNKDSIISEFIQKAYNQEVLIFTEGRCNIVPRLKVLWNADTIFLVYVDVVPDNQSTIDIYESLLDLIEMEHWDNVYVIPIPCIEFFLIKELWDRNLTEVKEIVTKGKYHETNLYISGSVDYSFERFCKAVVSRYGDVCKRVVRKTKAQPNGRSRYYLLDCLCNNYYENDGHTNKTLSDKAVQVIMQLPLYVVPDQINSCILELKHDEIEEIVEKQQKEFILWYNKYKEYGYI